LTLPPKLWLFCFSHLPANADIDSFEYQAGSNSLSGGKYNLVHNNIKNCSLTPNPWKKDD
jgi:hypothetical protein